MPYLPIRQWSKTQLWSREAVHLWRGCILTAVDYLVSDFAGWCRWPSSYHRQPCLCTLVRSADVSCCPHHHHHHRDKWRAATESESCRLLQPRTSNQHCHGIPTGKTLNDPISQETHCSRCQKHDGGKIAFVTSFSFLAEKCQLYKSLEVNKPICLSTAITGKTERVTFLCYI